MPTIRERVARFIEGPQKVDDERTEMAELADALLQAYQEGPFLLPPAELKRQLMEQYDTQTVQDLIDNMLWERFGAGYQTELESQRQRAVADGRRMWLVSILGQWIIRLWTYYGVGESLEVIPLDEKYKDGENAATVVWDEFWKADRNKPVLATERIHDISNLLLVTGNRFFAFFISDQDGESTIRRVKPEEITDIVTLPDDAATPCFYKRQWMANSTTRTEYYADWRWWFEKSDKEKEYLAPLKVKDKDAEVATRDGTVVVMLHVPFEQKDENSLFGWPLLAPAGTPWIRSHRQYFEARLAVARAVASYVRRRQVKGGSRAVDAVRMALQSGLQRGASSETNPPPVAGSEDIHNQAIQTTDLPLRTGAGDAKSDGEMFSWMAGLSGGIYPHYLGLGDAYRLATATAMEKPMQMQFSLYRNRLNAMFRDMVRIVLQAKERFGRGIKYETYEARIAADRLVELDLKLIVQSVGELFRDVVNPMLTAGEVPDDTLTNVMVFALQSVLSAMGAEDVNDMVNAEQFEQHAVEKEERREELERQMNQGDGDDEDEDSEEEVGGMRTCPSRTRT
jgi:hypothetical protein